MISNEQGINVSVLKEIHTRHGIIQLRSDNILVFRPDIRTFKEYDLEVLKELLEAFVKITDGIPRPYMCDNRHITGLITREEKAFIHKYASHFTTKMAAITHSPIMPFILNTYNLVFKPKMDIKLVKTEEEAVAWLLNSKD